MDNREATQDESPTDELPVLTEVDVVDLDASAILLTPDDDVILPGSADELIGGTSRFPLPDDLPDVDPFPELDDELAFLRRRILLLEATLDDKEAENASLAERLRATRDAVERRDETERVLRAELAEAAAERRRLEARLAEADALAAKYADRVAELTSRLRTLEQTVDQRDAAFAELEAELIAREAAVVERERALAVASGGETAPRSSGLEPPPATHAGEPIAEPTSAGAELEAALAGSREEAATLAAYIDCRRAHWLALETELEEHRVRVRELEQEVEQRAERERREAERAEAEARRAEALRTELAQWKARSSAAADASDETALERSGPGPEPPAAAPAARTAPAPAPTALEAASAAPQPAPAAGESRTATEPAPASREPAAPARKQAQTPFEPASKPEPAAAKPVSAGADRLGVEPEGAFPPPAAAELEEAPTATLRVQRPPEQAREKGPGADEPLGAALFCLTSDPPAEYGIGASALLIGRGTHCDIRIPTHFVSREHARIVRERDQIVIEDLGSKNGVFVNAVRVDRGALRHGDLVTIGETQFRFEAVTPDAAASA